MSKHSREGATPQNDGTLLGDCSCGATYSVPQGGDEFAALEAAQKAHELGATIPPASGLLATFTPDDLEALVITAAELWNTSGDAGDVLSEYQRKLAAHAYEWMSEH